MEAYQPSSLDSLLARDRAIVLCGLIGLSALAWLSMAYDAHHSACVLPSAIAASPALRGVVELALLFMMWAVMMVAMMVPSAAPMILMFAALNRKRLEQQRPFVPTSVFLLGYLIAWAGFSALATAAQWGLHRTALLSASMSLTSPLASALLILATGVFQFTPLKRACLVRCRSPLAFLTTEWREGAGGAFIMGWRHGGYCVGCCWFLMGLLFVAGVMNLLWVAAISAFVLFEKAGPAGKVISRAAGLSLVGWGAWSAIGALCF